MNNLAEAISLLREEVGKQIDVEQHAVAFLTNTFLDTYRHDGVGDEEDPTPSLINDIDAGVIQRVMLIVAGCALAFQQEAELAYEEDAADTPEMPDLDKAKWEAYLDGVITLTSGLMGLALNVSDTAVAEGELTIEDIIGQGGDGNGE